MCLSNIYDLLKMFSSFMFVELNTRETPVFEFTVNRESDELDDFSVIVISFSNIQDFNKVL
jgi:hypothetical protein